MNTLEEAKMLIEDKHISVSQVKATHAVYGRKSMERGICLEKLANLVKSKIAAVTRLHRLDLIKIVAGKNPAPKPQPLLQ